jgi:hypothetical protein
MEQYWEQNRLDMSSFTRWLLRAGQAVLGLFACGQVLKGLHTEARREIGSVSGGHKTYYHAL